jgi:ribosome-binding factor A
MGQRVVRVNELVKREISQVLHTRYQSEAVYITITDVVVAPNLRNAKVYYSVVGDEAQSCNAGRFFAREKREIRTQIGKVIVLKYLPVLEFIEDSSTERGAYINSVMDDMGLVGEVESPVSESDDDYDEDDFDEDYE